MTQVESVSILTEPVVIERTIEQAQPIALTLYTSLSAVKPLWRAFEAQADCTVFQKFDWLSEWYRCIGKQNNVVPVIVLGNDDHDNIVFILPFAIERHRLYRQLIWLGESLCDYNAPLIAPSFLSYFSDPTKFKILWRDIISTIQADPLLRCDIVKLEKMPKGLGSNPFLNLPVTNANFNAYAATLTGNWDQFYQDKISTRSRQTDRRKYRRLQEMGEIRFVEAQSSDIVQTTATLIEQKQESYARLGVKNIFDYPGVPQFYYAIIQNPALRDIIHVTRLEVGTQWVATGLALRFRSRYYIIMLSYDTDFATYSPGQFHVHGMLRYAIDNDMQIFDFTIGDESYKLHWSDIKTPLFSYYQGVTIRGRAVIAIIRWVQICGRSTWLKKIARPMLRWYHRVLG